ncbi:helix-turn-helix domain-containing protein [Paenibacillus sp. NPDC057967]|uniref:helix-turn-helix domain-containing protein n=1 Tax=Paenibacillus sp. NPDC057967 TaxID=3346293 RepID=UPI0036DE3567
MQINSYCYHLTGIDRLANEHELPIPFCSERYSLILILSGKGQITIGHDTAAFGPRKLYWCSPGEEITIQPASRQSVCLYSFLFDIIRLPMGKAGIAEQGDNPVFSWEKRELTLSDPGKSFRIAHGMHSLICNGASEAKGSSFKVQSLFYELLDMIASCHSDEGIPNARMEDVVAYVRAHYADDLPRNKLASMAGVHPDHFSRLFRKTTGRSYVEFVADIRISRAKERLLATKESLMEIARKVGYKDEFYFSRKFKQKVGTAPTIYLRKPKSIFSLACNYTAGLLVVGYIPPIGSLTPWISQRYGTVLRPGTFKPIYWDTCDIRRLKEEPRPDVILCHDKQYDAEQLELLREISPTLPIPIGSMDWRETLLDLADLLDKKQTATKKLEAYDQQVEQAKEKIRQKVENKTAAIVVLSEKEFIRWDMYRAAGCCSTRLAFSLIV